MAMMFSHPRSSQAPSAPKGPANPSVDRLNGKFESLILLDGVSSGGSSVHGDSDMENDLSDENLSLVIHMEGNASLLSMSLPHRIDSLAGTDENLAPKELNAPNHRKELPMRPPIKASMDATSTEIMRKPLSSAKVPHTLGGLATSLPTAPAKKTTASSGSSLSQAARLSMFLDKRIVLYKTEMCQAFQETGTCKYGFSCQFAHYREELRPVLRHPRYKTDICKTWWTSNVNGRGRFCPYGQRCCFIHDETPEELARLCTNYASNCNEGTNTSVKRRQGGRETSSPDAVNAQEAWEHLPADLQQLL